VRSKLLPFAFCLLPLLAVAQERPSFEEFLVGMRSDALAAGVTRATVDAALTNVEQLPIAVERDRTQPETVVSLDTYVARRLTKKVRTSATAQARAHSKLLRAIEEKYGVPPGVLIAVWGVESNFGQFTGVRPTIATLATLAYDGRRAELFRTELIAALKILDSGRATLEELKGSWAGAMGQPQFMPSSYLKYAVDFDEDGHANIWTSQADVFGSIANYLKEYGWHSGERWGREVSVSRAAMAKIDHGVPMRAGGCRATRQLTEPRELSEWKKLGVTLTGGRPLPNADIKASLVRGDKRFFLAYRNYDALIGYNCANSYAIAVALLSDVAATGVSASR
jgi:membrane-bound lytic murein transglycosylase B